MSNLNRDIGTEDFKIEELVKMLKEDKFLVPTFQRDFVWQPANILKLWDSIYKFYPMGSILYWETDKYLHTHRKLGGFIFPHDEDTVRKFNEWKYILDGQQRATSLLISLLGGIGRVEDNDDFDYTLYFDATKAEFFFPVDLDKRKAEVGNHHFLIRVRDVPNWSFTFYKEIANQPGFDKTIENNLAQLSRLFSDYKLPVVRVRGVEVSEVCEIFERINQEGKRLDPVDIIVARTYRNADMVSGNPGFYLRDNLDSLKTVLIQQGNRYQEIDDLTIIQMIAVCLRKQHKEGRNPFGITPAALENLTAAHFEDNWQSVQKTILQTIKNLCDLKIHGPSMLPYTYLALPLCYYLHENPNPDRDFSRQWFWRTAFAPEDFRTSTDVYRHCEEVFAPLEQGKPMILPPLVLSKARLLQTSYNYRNVLSRAVLAFLANQNPLDFSDPHAIVLDNVYLLLSQAPNLHHIYPQNFLKKKTELPAGITADSLMNICFIRADTNIHIGDKNPLTYFKDYAGKRGFDKILKSHLIPRKYIERDRFEIQDYIAFLMDRAQWFVDRLKEELPDVEVTIVD